MVEIRSHSPGLEFTFVLPVRETRETGGSVLYSVQRSGALRSANQLQLLATETEWRLEIRHKNQFVINYAYILSIIFFTLLDKTTVMPIRLDYISLLQCGA